MGGGKESELAQKCAWLRLKLKGKGRGGGKVGWEGEERGGGRGVTKAREHPPSHPLLWGHPMVPRVPDFRTRDQGHHRMHLWQVGMGEKGKKGEIGTHSGRV